MGGEERWGGRGGEERWGGRGGEGEVGRIMCYCVTL